MRCEGAYSGAVDPTWLATAAQQSPLGAALATFPWETTPLGPLSTWDTSLRQTVQMCFSTRFPVMIAWGPDLTMIYNDGYEQLLGTEKSRDALGRSARDVWSEAWDALGPLFDDLLTTGEATWTTDFPLLINRSGFDEETYFTYSYSPLVGDDGRTLFVLCATGTFWSVAVGAVLAACTTVVIRTWFRLVGVQVAVKLPRK